MKTPPERASIGYFTGWWFFRIYTGLYHRRRVFNEERVPRTGGVILAANHLSYIDPPLVGCSTRRVIHYLARESAFKNPIGGAILRSWNSIPVDRDGGSAKGLRTILERLREGRAIMMFPEGTRSPDGTQQPARGGIGLLIAKSKSPVLPVRVFGTFEAFGRRHLIPRPCGVSVKFGELMEFEELRAEANEANPDRRRGIYRQISGNLMDAIAALKAEQD
ncbi:MAG: 1-acyl-sn-glycerol-3-phosphate acyltransferase [Verrucomicrobiales bacterium]|nr:1-acyl-sn-glycerol-3-phosphate acyltransferase [Verrucomicrobiales bacterium]